MLEPVLTSVRPRRWLPSVFSIVPEGAARRRPTDLLRTVVGAVLVAIAAAGTRRVGDLEQQVYEWLADLEAAVGPVARVVYVGVVPVTLAVIVGAAFFARRWRFVATLAAAAGVAGAAAVALDRVVGGPTAASLQEAGVDLSGGAPDFPPLLLVVVFAALFAASPYLTRPARRLTHLIMVAGAFSAMVLLAGLPAGVVAGLALAWASSSLVWFALRTPAGTPTLGEVRDDLADLGLTCDEVTLDSVQVFGESRYLARAGGETYQVVVFGRDATDTRLVAKLVRFIWYKDSGPTLILSRARLVEHRAYLLLLAARAGVAVPEVVAAGTAGDLGHALLVTREPTGPTLAELGHGAIDDERLADAWRNLGALHAAGIAHGDLTLDAIVALPDGRTAISDLGRSAASASPERLRRDEAELLAASAAVVGVERAVEAAAGVLGDDGLSAVLPYLQVGVVSHRTRQAIEHPKVLVAAVREGAAGYLGIEVPELTELKRVSTGNLLMAAGAILGVYLLIGQLAGLEGMGDVFAGADWSWVAVAFVLSQTPQLAQAVAMLGSVAIRLPLGPVTAVQFANNFTGLVGGTVATTALVVRFFQKQGQTVAVAISSGVLNTLGAMVVQAVLIVLGLALTGQDFDIQATGGGGSSGWVVVAVVAVGGLSGVVLLVPRFRHRVSAKVRPQFTSARENLRVISTTPRKPLQLLSGNLASQLLFAMTLGASLLAYGDSLPLLQLVLINSFASLLGGMAPVPGGMGVIEAGLIGGLTAAGVPEETAVAATFTHRLFTAYLPPIWGWFSLRWLGRHDYV